MSNYIKRTEPGRIVRKETIIEKIVRPSEEKSFDTNTINALANAIAQIIGTKISKDGVEKEITADKIKVFDDSGTLKRLAKEMLVQRGDSQSNFDNLGDIQITKKDQKDVDETIDLLSKLDN